MIRVNLIGSAKGRSRRGPGGKGVSFKLPEIPNVGLLFALLLLVGIGAIIYSWRDSAAATADQLTHRIELRKMELDSLKARKKLIDDLKKDTEKMATQALVFEQLFADRVGPVNALTYLSFILQPRDEATASPDELKALESAGWRVAWDARKAWFGSVRETNGEVTLQGQALGHEDVAEVMRRLESSPYFRETKLAYQERKHDDRLGADFVEFTIHGSLVYLIKPLHPEETPPEAAAAADGDAGPTGDAASGADAGGAAPEHAAEPAAAAPKAAKAEAMGSQTPDVIAAHDATPGPDAAPVVPVKAPKPEAPAPAPPPPAPPEARLVLPDAPPAVDAPPAPAPSANEPLPSAN